MRHRLTAVFHINGLNTKHLRIAVVHERKVRSTQDQAKSLASDGALEGTTVIADEQTAGKGRAGRRWYSPKGGVWLSLILRPTVTIEKAPLIGLLAALSTINAIKVDTGLDASIKWPNDILFQGRKVGGILSQSSIKGDSLSYLVLGIGVNLNFRKENLPNKVQSGATTLMDEVGKRIDKDAFIRDILLAFDSLYQSFLESDSDAILREIESRMEIVGRMISVKTAHGKESGRAVGLAANGALRMLFPDGSEKSFYAGDVSLVDEGV